MLKPWKIGNIIQGNGAFHCVARRLDFRRESENEGGGEHGGEQTSPHLWTFLLIYIWFFSGWVVSWSLAARLGLTFSLEPACRLPASFPSDRQRLQGLFTKTAVPDGAMMVACSRKLHSFITFRYWFWKVCCCVRLVCLFVRHSCSHYSGHNFYPIIFKFQNLEDIDILQKLQRFEMSRSKVKGQNLITIGTWDQCHFVRLSLTF